MWIFLIDSLIGGLDQQANKMITTSAVCFRLRLSGVEGCVSSGSTAAFLHMHAGTIRRIPRGNNAFFAVISQPRQATSTAHSLLIPVTDKTRLSRLLLWVTGCVAFFRRETTGSRSWYHAVVVPSVGKCTLCGSTPSARSRSSPSGESNALCLSQFQQLTPWMATETARHEIRHQERPGPDPKRQPPAGNRNSRKLTLEVQL